MRERLDKDIEYFMDGLSWGLYAIVNVTSRFNQKLRELDEPRRLSEPFLADIVRGMYRTLEYFKIQDPRRKALLKEIRGIDYKAHNS